MLFSSRLPLKSLIELCRVLRHNLSAGLSLRHVFRQQAERGPMAVRRIASRVSDRLVQGESLIDSLEAEKKHFPPLFIALTSVGEESGRLPEVFEELDKYFSMVQRLRNQFISQIAWPVLQFCLVPFVLAGVSLILGMLNSTYSPLGPSLSGTAGAIRILVGWFGSIAILVGIYLFVTRTLSQGPLVAEILLRVPALGPCLYSMAMTRFCIAFHATMETGMPVTRALKLSLKATANPAFEAHVERVAGYVRGGEELTEALRKTGVFRQEFLDILANAEEGGKVTEVMTQQAKYYEEDTLHRMALLTQAATWLVWLVVAGTIIFFIFKMMMSYLNLLSSFGA